MDQDIPPEVVQSGKDKLLEVDIGYAPVPIKVHPLHQVCQFLPVANHVSRLQEVGQILAIKSAFPRAVKRAEEGVGLKVGVVGQFDSLFFRHDLGMGDFANHMSHPEHQIKFY